MKKSKECVKVAVRCRPMSSTEMADNRKLIVATNPKKGEIAVTNVKNDGTDPIKTFTFDYVYDWTCTQEGIYNDCAYPIISSVLEGYNGTIFAYGQTGTGKTFTMEGAPKPPEKKGIIPRSFEHIFRVIEGSPGQQFLVRVSMIELYNEEIRDLLSKHHTSKLELREKPDTGVYVKDLSMHVVNSVEEMTSKLKDGTDNRITAATNMNERSSRSHCLFSICVENSVTGADKEEHFRMGKLNLVDLAGSEKQKKTGAEGKRFEEAKSINLSLTILGNVISSLTDPKCTHVPYRDSKLTRLLQDSLGGNAKTFMFANIGPADYNFDETMSTLRYAHRAKSITNAPKINEDPKDALLRQYQDEIQNLKNQLALQGGGAPMPGGIGHGGAIEKVIKVQDEAKMKELEEKLAREKEEIKMKAEKERQKIEQEKSMAEDEKLKLLEVLNKKEADERATKEKQEKLLKKLKKMESKMLVGNKVMQKAVMQEKELMEAKKVLEEQRIQQLRYEEELKKKEELNLDLEKKFSSQQEEIDEKTKKLKKLMAKFKSVQDEMNNMHEVFNKNREELLDQNREYFKTIRLKELIISHFIPAEEVQKIESRAEWSDERDDWLIPLASFTGRSLRNKAMQSVYGLKRPIADSSLQKSGGGISVNDTRASYENVQHFDLDMPEDVSEDFNPNGDHSAIARAAIQIGIHNDEEDLKFIQMEAHPNVYFDYSEDGGVRRPNPGTEPRKQAPVNPPPTQVRKPSATTKRQPSAVKRPDEVKKDVEEDDFPKSKGLARKGFK